MRTYLAALALPLALAACSGGPEGEETAESNASPRTPVSIIPTNGGEPELTTANRPKYPEGYPRKVAVSALPRQVASSLEGESVVVAVAPGVWTRLAPSATVEESAEYGTLVGWCASISVYEKRFMPQPRGHSCF